MHWNSKTYREKLEEKENWHQWFAWYPVQIDKCPEENTPTQTVWLETIWRSGTDMLGCWKWRYSWRKPTEKRKYLKTLSYMKMEN